MVVTVFLFLLAIYGVVSIVIDIIRGIRDLRRKRSVRKSWDKIDKRLKADLAKKTTKCTKEYDLKHAIESEDFERAAILRDEISKLNQK